MGNFKKVFIIGFIGGLAGYACGVAFNPTRAVAQGINPGDGSNPGDEGQGSVDASTGTPSVPPAANGPPPACRQWEVKFGPSVYGQGAPNSVTLTVEEGWEPYAWSDNWGAPVTRRCIR